MPRKPAWAGTLRSKQNARATVAQAFCLTPFFRWVSSPATAKTTAMPGVLTWMNHFALKEQGVRSGLKRVLVSDESVSVNEAHKAPESYNGTNDAECLLLGTGALTRNMRGLTRNINIHGDEP